MSFSDTMQMLRSRYHQDNPQARYNPWFLGMLGVMLVFLLVNIFFIVMAAVTSPGLVVEDYYEQGRKYEQHTIKLVEARATLRWQTEFDFPERIIVGQAVSYRFSAVDNLGLPILDHDVILKAYRPSDVAADFVTPLNWVAPGVYQGEAVFTLAGIWDVTVEVPHGKTMFQQTRRIYVLPQ